MAKHLDQRGNQVAADNPSRMIWYGICTYWTDDWGKLGAVGEYKIPCCPICNRPGFQVVADEWDKGARNFQTDNPHYLEFLAQSKETCKRGMSFQGLYKEWLKEQGNLDDRQQAE